MSRIDGRDNNELRDIQITSNYTKYAQGSVLMAMGETKVLCTAMIEDRVPIFLRGQGKGWVTAEYNMLPSSTATRKQRSVTKGKLDGRSVEIQRLIGRALRSVVDLEKLGERTIWIDCDVIQADGGTRTTAITGAFIALVQAVDSLMEQGMMESSPVVSHVAATSVGIVDGVPMLDLCYEEDAKAQVDMNIVMTEKEEFIELQGTGEEHPFSKEQFDQLLQLAGDGIQTLIERQRSTLKK
ncbi:MAG TPA: ribonuclease PH [Eubacteriaceae bacterium]|nr:ribonuclease PH [Eubacteriaceae bacterium]